MALTSGTGNDLGDEACKALQELLVTNKALKELDLSGKRGIGRGLGVADDLSARQRGWSGRV